LSGGYKKGRQRKTACLKLKKEAELDVRLGLTKTGDAIAGFPLSALLEQVDALEALQDVAFDDEAVGALETFML
jgi:hypothetical protein